MANRSESGLRINSSAKDSTQFPKVRTWMGLTTVGKLNSFKDDKFVIADTSRFMRYAQWNQQGRGYSTCFWAALQTVITPNGKIWRCTSKREHPDGLLGDLAIESFAEAWARSGGACGVNRMCRVSCKGDLGNQSLDGIMAQQAHASFI